ncbi:MAG TPA: ABC transporter ATP-binding protein [Vicinamibacterales bacterium]|nr:ABC transporter ATP-binding protein [Vicinamibacterales bacterium]
MNDVVIRAVDVKKVYRLYAKPSYRFRDMFGLLGDRPGAYTEHAALDGVSLEIMRGEKVAIIGRNGAGKSTLLKIITHVIQPTSGVLEVAGRVQALLQIGTGFHPDFTGRENVMAYFAQLGIAGDEARRQCDAAIAFAELEEYIDQPIKTYSTGMGVRLMFAASTAITPDLLVLDEVLGVGDAYFAHKSYERIRELCDQNGATAVLVTHDIYSAARICSRVIWIDRGRVLFDGDAASALKVYEDSVRQQEESRLRTRKRERLRALGAASPDRTRPWLLFEIAGAAGRTAVPVYFSAIELLAGGRPVARVAPGEAAFDETAGSHLEREGAAWGDAVVRQGRGARPLLNYGSPFQKVAGAFAVSKDDLDRGNLALSLESSADAPVALAVRAFSGDQEFEAEILAVEPGGWTRGRVPLVPRSSSGTGAGEVNLSGVHGTGRVVVRNAAFVDPRGGEIFVLEHGRPVALEVAYRVVDPSLARQAQVVVAWHRNGVQDVCRFFASDICLDGVEGMLRLSIDRLAVTDGQYSITIMITEAGYYDREQTTFYAMNPGVHCCLSRLFDVEVVDSGLVGSGTMAVIEGGWSVRA